MSSGGKRAEGNDRHTEQFRKLFIGGLTLSTTEDMLKEFYSTWGDVVDVVVMRDRRSGKSRGFGFITYKEPDMVDAAQTARPHEIDGRTVEAKRAMPREDSASPEAHMTVTKLFVGGLKKEVTNEELKDYFSQYGTISECEIVMSKETGTSRGFAFVTYDDYDAVDKAILYKPHQIGGSRADVKKALSREQMMSMKRKREPRYDFNAPYQGGGGGYNPRGPPTPYGAGSGGYGGGYDGYNDGYGNMNGNGTNGQMMDYSGGWKPRSAAGGGGSGGGGGGGGHNNWNQSGMGDGFGQYGNQQGYGGGPMRNPPPSYQRNQPYGGGYNRR